MSAESAVTAILDDVASELQRARSCFPPINSPHEGKAVIEEELDELWVLIRENAGRTQAAYQEAMQIAAMAVRYALDLRPGAADA